MSKPTLHLLGVPHTLSFDERYSHCAFTTKVNRFVPMMRSVGYPVVHYGNAQSAIANYRGFSFDHYQIFSPQALEEYVGKFEPESTKFIGHHADANGPLYVEFNARLAVALKERVEPGDIVCCPFGYAHHGALAEVKSAFIVETGIGYEDSFAKFRIFESNAWMHYNYGKQSTRGNNQGSDYNWVIPNYFDLTEWTPSYSRGSYVLFFGRIGQSKGMDIVREIALRRPDLKFVVCGQGDGTAWLTPNMELRAPVFGKARSDLLREAIAVLVPSRYVEPFGGVAVEAMLCGRPALTSVFGAFSETVGQHSFQCRTLKDWLSALKMCEQYSRAEHWDIRTRAERFDMFNLAGEYDSAFQQISKLTGEGWFDLS